MDQLYAPWRDGHQKNKDDAKVSLECPFCPRFKESDDQKNLIVKRYKTCAVMLSIKPYTLGHVMIIPYKHMKSLTGLTIEERQDLMEAITESMVILEDHLKCDGINMGFNKGKVSGGSVEDHLHIHLVPRFIGDSGFLVTCGNTRILSFDIDSVCQRLTIAFNS